MTRNRIPVTLTYQGRTFELERGEFEAIILSARCHLYQTEQELKETPIDWDSSSVRAQFENVLEDIHTTKSNNDCSAHVMDWLNKRGAYTDDQAITTEEKDTP